jgi:hypothetical protein
VKYKLSSHLAQQPYPAPALSVEVPTQERGETKTRIGEYNDLQDILESLQLERVIHIFEVQHQSIFPLNVNSRPVKSTH